MRCSTIRPGLDQRPGAWRGWISSPLSRQPARWLFFRLAVLVTLVLWLPDLYLLDLGQPGRAVAVLMVMHLAIALVTYNCLVHIARVRAAARPARHARVPAVGPGGYAGR